MLRDYLGAAIVGVAVCASGCASRSKPGGVLPIPLANALIPSDETRAPSYSVGTLPPGFPEGLRPPGVTVVGGMRTNYSIVAVLSDSTRPVANLVEGLLEKNGFKRPPPVAGSGFSDAYTNPFCNDSGMVSVTQLAGASRHMARVDFIPMRGRRCSQLEEHTSHGVLKLPALKPPPGVSVVRAGGGRGGNGVNSEAEMSGSRLTPSEILKHYADQLVAAGWTAGDPAVSERVAAQFFEAVTPEGDRWTGVLMVAGGGASIRLSLDMRKSR